jgi:hypothetical protein
MGVKGLFHLFSLRARTTAALGQRRPPPCQALDCGGSLYVAPAEDAHHDARLAHLLPRDAERVPLWPCRVCRLLLHL